MSMFDLSGKVALITGSSRGIGKAIAMQMALHGHALLRVTETQLPRHCWISGQFGARCACPR